MFIFLLPKQFLKWCASLIRVLEYDFSHSFMFSPLLQRCVSATPCQFQVINPDRVADCLPECDTLTRNSLLQLTDKIAFSCDYSSFQSILNCGNCMLALCEFENRFNPETKACVVKYYNEIWPCYRAHFSEWVHAVDDRFFSDIFPLHHILRRFCNLEMPVCSAPANQVEASTFLVVVLFLIGLLHQ